MEREEIKAIVENILLAADQPVSVDQFQGLFANGTEKAVLREVLEELVGEYRSRNLQIMEVAEGFQLCTRHDYSDWVRKFLKLDKTAKLTQPSLDTLAIIAYKQPLTRVEVEEIRGVDSSGVMRTLLEKKVISPGGRKKVPGRPIMYRTTRKFLEYFGLKDLSDLPTLEDFKESELADDQDSSEQTSLPFDGPASAEEAEAGDSSPDS
ncbi:segregation and condensation protein B [Candidatus Nitromaritima sp. SCGC AAA799-C22]|nr:segregation and condensation protein B [Candidatus Nitromaritima sp. SCGC AAA799-C22]